MPTLLPCIITLDTSIRFNPTLLVEKNAIYVDIVIDSLFSIPEIRPVILGPTYLVESYILLPPEKVISKFL